VRIEPANEEYATMTKCWFRLATLSLAFLFGTSSLVFASATVSYQGYMYNFNGLPAEGDRAIAATFAPAFDPFDIACVYGDDVCNIDADFFEHAVADGNIFPIGNFVTINANGFFTGSGTTDAPEGTNIYLFGLNYSIEGAIATSSHDSYLVPAMGGTANIDAALANQFVFGNPFENGIGYGILPFPEPSTTTLAFIGLVSFLSVRRRQLAS
jgi:hypothetical protein